jgi:hypothetical protein
MKKKNFMFASLISLLALLFTIETVLAHETITIGNYEIEVGWVNEPPIVGQQNGIVVNVSDTSNGDAQPVEDVSALTVSVSYGGQEKILTLQPLGEDTPGQFVAPILPTVAGQYTVKLGGNLGNTAVNAEVEPEEVASADTLQFPGVEPAAQNTSAGMESWLIYLSLLIGLIALVLGVMALRKKG